MGPAGSDLAFPAQAPGSLRRRAAARRLGPSHCRGRAQWSGPSSDRLRGRARVGSGLRSASQPPARRGQAWRSPGSGRQPPARGSAPRRRPANSRHLAHPCARGEAVSSQRKACPGRSCEVEGRAEHLAGGDSTRRLHLGSLRSLSVRLAGAVNSLPNFPPHFAANSPPRLVPTSRGCFCCPRAVGACGKGHGPCPRSGGKRAVRRFPRLRQDFPIGGLRTAS